MLNSNGLILHAIVTFTSLLLAASAVPVKAQPDSAARVLIVIAHPDDDAAFAGTVYKLTHDLGGQVDLALVTNGEGGYKYSTLAEPIYGLKLTDEEIGRRHLPTIRKKELMAGGAIVGIRDYFFLDEIDHEYTLNVDTVLHHVWDVRYVRNRLVAIMKRGKYDYVFTLLPVPGTHGHHKGATILALEAARELPGHLRPVVLGTSTRSRGDTVDWFSGLPGYPVTAVRAGRPAFSFDRTQKFGYRDRLDYSIIVNWLIAEHKSQGTMQLLMNRGELEEYWFFDMNDPSRHEAAGRLFGRLAVNRYRTMEY